ncbi:MAG: 50S ribosomal protein L28 [Christensenellaceae bacterium]|jgi:ribosomal protein L28|nr:50S ribosomal protein L28 [Christensenellaceae bacterium]
MRICTVCGKREMHGKKVSHSNIKTPRRWRVNVQKVNALQLQNGEVVSGYVCSRCIRTAHKVASK